ncbi:MAG: hypothetical protein ACUZ8I_08375 [Candidatus Scalindua sp.]
MTAKEIEREWNKDMEKRNFIRWYRNVTPGEIKKVKGEGKIILERLFIEYTDEIEMINKSKYHISLYSNQI